jgi:outer membrane protein assembly factor BamB
LEVTLYTSTALFDDLKHQWNLLLRDSGADCIFLTYEWQSSWWDAYHPGEIWALAVREGGQLVGLAPWFVQREGKDRRVVRAIGCVDVTDYLEIIACQGLERAVFEALAEFIATRGDDFDDIRLCNVPEASPTAQVLPEICAEAGFHMLDGRPVVRVDLYDPALQSPEYGGGPTRDRYVPAVKAGPPKGKPTWMFDAITLIEFPPAVVDGQVVFGVNSGRVFALDADTGKVLWEDRVKGAIASAPAIADGTAYITSMDGMLTAYRLADGKRLWQYSTGGSPIESSPLVHAGKVYFGAWNGTVYAVDARRPKLVWSRSMSAEIKGSVALAGERILVGDYSGRVSAFGAASGEERWTYRGGQRFYGGPGVSGNLAVIGDVGGAVIALDVRTGAERWRHTTGDWVYGSPAIADGRVFIGSYDGNFQALDLATGAVRWTHAAGGRISGSATVIDGIVYTSILYREGQPRKTWGLDVRTGAVRWQNDDGRYSPAVGAGSTVYIVGTKLLRAYRSKTPAAP